MKIFQGVDDSIDFCHTEKDGTTGIHISNTYEDFFVFLFRVQDNRLIEKWSWNAWTGFNSDDFVLADQGTDPGDYTVSLEGDVTKEIDLLDTEQGDELYAIARGHITDATFASGYRVELFDQYYDNGGGNASLAEKIYLVNDLTESHVNPGDC